MRTVLFGGFVGLLVGCAPVASPDRDRQSSELITERKTIAELIDHPERFKGKTLKLSLSIDTPIFGSEGDSLRKYAGKDVQFFGYGDKDQKLNITIQMPQKDIPNAVSPDTLAVTFICKDGALNTGNVATRVERP